MNKLSTARFSNQSIFEFKQTNKLSYIQLTEVKLFKAVVQVFLMICEKLYRAKQQLIGRVWAESG